jgi:dCTP deaminase
MANAMGKSGTLNKKDAAAPVMGIYPCQMIRDMVRCGEIMAPAGIMDDQVQPASIDLRLGDYAYPVTTSFLPGHGVKVLEKMKRLDPNFEDYKIPLNGTSNGALLEKGRVYVIPLMESIGLKSDTAAFANPKSSTGRLDILTRLIADEATSFDQVECGYKGQLYVEVAPRSFSVVMKAGTRLNQLRFRETGSAGAAPILSPEWSRLIEDGQIIEQNGDAKKALRLSENAGVLPFTVDLQGSGQAGALIGWRAKQNSGRIDLARRDYDPEDF